MVKFSGLRWPVFIALSAILTGCTSVMSIHPLERSAIASPSPNDGFIYGRLWMIADNQQRELLGDTSFYSAKLAQKSNVAIRSIQQELFSKFVAQSVVSDIRSKELGGQNDLILHLGDALDYGCQSEFKMLARMSWFTDPKLLIAIGNHDVAFQGNSSYGGIAGWLVLTLRKIFVNPSIEPWLEGHHNAVCTPMVADTRILPPDVMKLGMKDRYRNETRQRKFFDAREWPQNFACDYLRSRAGEGYGQSVELRQFCEDARFFSYFFNDHHADGNAIQPAPISGPAPGHQMWFASDTKKFYSWNRAHMLQRVEVPLGKGGKESNRDSIGVILLDTSDWETRPSWAPWQTRSNAHKGNVGKLQGQRVKEWIREWSKPENKRIKGIVLAGHYPLRAMENDTLKWMANLQVDSTKVLPLYLSAHTHEGFEDEGSLKESVSNVRPIREINVGSLVDAPVHYRDVVFGWSELRQEVEVISNVHHPESDWGCSCDARAEDWHKARATAAEFSVGTDSDQRIQWCRRLTAMNPILAQYPADKPADAFVPMAFERCVDPKKLDLRNENHSTDDVLRSYRLAEFRMIDKVAKDRGRARILACQSIAGSTVYDWHPALPKPARLSFVLKVPS